MVGWAVRRSGRASILVLLMVRSQGSSRTLPGCFTPIRPNTAVLLVSHQAGSDSHSVDLVRMQRSRMCQHVTLQAGVIAIGGIATAAFGGQRAWRDIQHGDIGFRSFCAA